MQRAHRTAVAIAVALAVTPAVGGCGPVNAGSAAQQEIHDRLEADFGDHLVEVRVSAENTLPFMGRSSGSAVLAPDTPPEVFTRALDTVATFRPEHGEFEGVGVIGNGVGVCLDDPERAARQALRDALHAAGVSLAGEWPCGSRREHGSAPYVGTVADLAADLLLVHEHGDPAGLTLEATLTRPAGTVSAPLEAVPPAFARVLTAVKRRIEIVRFAFGGGQLRIAVAPTAEVAAILAAARTAAGDRLEVEILLGSLEDDAQDDYERVAPVVDALRALPDVAEVTAHRQGASLHVPDPDRARAVHDDAVGIPGTDRIALTIRVGRDTEGAHGTVRASEWRRPSGGRSESFAAFLALLTRPEVAHVTVREADGGEPREVFVELAGPLLGGARLRDLPVGAVTRIRSRAEGSGLTFTPADRLTAEDVAEPYGPVDVGAFVAAWNAAR